MIYIDNYENVVKWSTQFSNQFVPYNLSSFSLSAKTFILMCYTHIFDNSVRSIFDIGEKMLKITFFLKKNKTKITIFGTGC